MASFYLGRMAVVGSALVFSLASLALGSFEGSPVESFVEVARIEREAQGRSVAYVRIRQPANLSFASPDLAQAPAAESEAIDWGEDPRLGKRHVSLLLSATVFGDVTELRWRSGGRDWRAFSSVDFRELAGFSEIETADSVFSWFCFASAIDAWQPSFAGETHPELPAGLLFAEGRSDYLVEVGPGALPEDDPGLDLLDAIHAFHELNRDTLAAQRRARELEWSERERQLRDNPPRPKDTVIRFWPIRSRANPN
jgi:hypothetical protein